MFQLRFPEDHLAEWARKYMAAARQEEIERERDVETRVSQQARERGFLDRKDFLLRCRWKTARPQSHCARNTEAAVEEVTRVALLRRGRNLARRPAAGTDHHSRRWGAQAAMPGS